MTRVLLIGPYNPGSRAGQFLSPPLGVYRLASYISRLGIAKVDVCDPSLDLNETYTMLRGKKYDIIGHSILHPTIENDLRIVFDAHQIQPDALKIAGGQGVAFNYRLFLEQTPIEIVVRGFGEKSLSEIIQRKDNLVDIPGLYVRKGNNIVETQLNGLLTHEEFREFSMSMDFGDIPYEKYWGAMEERYTDSHLHIMKNTGMLRTVRLMSSNYCPMGCTFCSSTHFLNEGSANRQKLVQLSPDDVVFWINQAVMAHPETEAFYFNDDDFMLNRRRLESILSLLSKLSEKYKLLCQSRVDDVDPGVLSDMKKSGFERIFYGVETFSNDMALKINKTRSRDYQSIARRAILNTLDSGIVPQISLMLFLPDSKIDDLEITIENATEMLLAGARVTVFPFVEAYPGAEIVSSHELEYRQFQIGDNLFSVPYLVLPDDYDVRRIASEAEALRQRLNQPLEDLFGSILPQPIDALNLFKAVYLLSGKKTETIDNAIHKILSE